VRPDLARVPAALGLSERIGETDPQRLAAAVSALFVDAVLPLPGG
jgi:hypothetical protein